MKYLTILILTTICTCSSAQRLFLEVDYSSGIQDFVTFGFSGNATLGIDTIYNEENIYGTPLQSNDLRSIQRIPDYGRDCQYENRYDENIDSKINFRQMDLTSLRSRSFEFVLTTQDTNFNIRLTAEETLLLDYFISFEPDTCRTPGFPQRFRLEQDLGEVNLKPLMRSNGLTAVNYIVITVENITVLTNTQEHILAGFSISPNPASDFVTISNEDHIIQEISILDPLGNTIQKENGFLDTTINFELNPDLQGLYLIRVKYDDNEILTQKLYID